MSVDVVVERFVIVHKSKKDAIGIIHRVRPKALKASFEFMSVKPRVEWAVLKKPVLLGGQCL